jgi:hypothetical protein
MLRQTRMKAKDLVTSRVGEPTASRGGRAKRRMTPTDPPIHPPRTPARFVELYASPQEVDGILGDLADEFSASVARRRQVRERSRALRSRWKSDSRGCLDVLPQVVETDVRSIDVPVVVCRNSRRRRSRIRHRAQITGIGNQVLELAGDRVPDHDRPVVSARCRPCDRLTSRRVLERRADIDVVSRVDIHRARLTELFPGGDEVAISGVPGSHQSFDGGRIWHPSACRQRR